MTGLREQLTALVIQLEDEIRLLALGPNGDAHSTRGIYYAALCQLRTYPHGDQYLTSLQHHIRLCCQYCHRPLRLFGTMQGAPWRQLECAVCIWKQRNPEVARVVAYRLWPSAIHPDFRPLVLTFLCWEDIIVRAQSVRGCLAPITPQIASIGHVRAWHALLLTGVRSAVQQFPYIDLPLTRPNSNENKDNPQGIRSRARTIQRWAILMQLWENRLWRLVLSCHHRTFWIETRTGRLEAGRPLTVMLSYLGPP